MRPIKLRTRSLVLDQPTLSDAEAVWGFCQDPLFEQFLTVPWPYQLSDAEFFVGEHVPRGWGSDSEYTWALRAAEDSPLLGVVSFRVEGANIGFWMGAPSRGRGLMTEAVVALADWVFERGVQTIAWECLVGNAASLAVARKAGFAYAGVAPAQAHYRDGTNPLSWRALLSAGDTREPKPGWPR